MFKLIGIGVDLKDPEHVMPSLQFSKCVEGTVINPRMDNGRIISCEYFELYTNEIDLEILMKHYKAQKFLCVEVEAASKDYLPRWFTDFIFGLFVDKCKLTVEAEKDPSVEVLRTLKKYQVNGCYGMCVQKSIKDDIQEDYTSTDILEAYTLKLPKKENGDVDEEKLEEQRKKEYEKYLNKKTSILSYAWGVWVTSYAFRNVHRLNECLKDPGDADFYDEGFSLLLYNDTDSAYAHGWDEEKIKAYNDNCLKLLRANGYDSVIIEGNVFTLGIAEHKPLKDDYTEFKTMGAKRYAGRCKKDNKIHITVAGVPKEKGAETLKDDLNNFHVDWNFKGSETGKKQHVYFSSDIYIDEDGNETADSIDLLPGDYLLSATEKFDLESLFAEEMEMYYVE